MLLDIAAEIAKVVLITFIILGTIGNVLNLVIFARPILLRSPCTLYLIAASIDNILVIYSSLLTRLLASGFYYDITILSDFLCKFRYYPGYIFLAVSPYFYALACFDRYCSSSTSSTRRLWSNKKLAKRLIIGAIVLATVLYVHMAIFFERKPSGSSYTCYTRPGVYNTFYRIFYLIVYCFLPSFCMALLCILTLKNIRRQARQIGVALATGSEGHRRLDRHMIRMLFSQILTQFFCILPFATISLLSLCMNSTTIIFSFFNQITILPLFVSYAISFYVFTMSSRIYRKELLKFIWFRERANDEREFSLRTVTTGMKLRPNVKAAVNEDV
jgi:hypothetical protein